MQRSSPLLVALWLAACGGKAPEPLPTGTGTGTGTGGSAGEDCADGADNDGDGLLDCEDDDCANAPACFESACDDGTDNDGDGFIDCTDADCWGRGCAVTRARITSAGRVYWREASLDFTPTNGCTSYHLDTATIELASPTGVVRVLTSDAGPDNWVECNWSADRSVVKDLAVDGALESPFAAPRPLLREGFTVDAACPVQNQALFLPIVVTLDTGTDQWALRTGVAGGGPPWFGMSGPPNPYGSNSVNGPAHSASSCSFVAAGASQAVTWSTADVSFDFLVAVDPDGGATTTGTTR